jgi:hypothetical protein
MTTPSSADLGWAPDACTLPTTEQPLRLAEFDALFARHVTDVRRESGTRLVLTLIGGPQVAAAAADLAARETGCCAFFAFDPHIADDALTLTVSASEQHADVLAALGDRAKALAGTAA